MTNTTKQKADALAALNAEFKEALENTTHLESIVSASDVVSAIATMDDLKEFMQTYIDEDEVIYHSTAMKFLTQYDPSLTLSHEIASEYGLEVGTVNSEQLATLLTQNLATAELHEIADLPLFELVASGDWDSYFEDYIEENNI